MNKLKIDEKCSMMINIKKKNHNKKHTYTQTLKLIDWFLALEKKHAHKTPKKNNTIVVA